MRQAFRVELILAAAIAVVIQSRGLAQRGDAPPKQTASGPSYQYACHEGNYGLHNILAGRRVKETAPSR